MSRTIAVHVRHKSSGVNLKFAQKLSFLFSSEFAALGIHLRYGKIISIYFHYFCLTF